VIGGGASLFGLDTSDPIKVMWKDLKFQIVDNDGSAGHVWVARKLHIPREFVNRYVFIVSVIR